MFDDPDKIRKSRTAQAEMTPDEGRHGGHSDASRTEGTFDLHDVIIVDDDTDDRMLVLKTLKKSPYIQNVRFFRSGEDLISHYQSEGYYTGNLLRLVPTLIILDINLPGRDGIEILEYLKSQPATKDIPVILLSGEISAETKERARRLNVNGLLEKPLQLADVHAVLETGWSRQEDAL